MHDGCMFCPHRRRLSFEILPNLLPPHLPTPPPADVTTRLGRHVARSHALPASSSGSNCPSTMDGNGGHNHCTMTRPRFGQVPSGNSPHASVPLHGATKFRRPPRQIIFFTLNHGRTAAMFPTVHLNLSRLISLFVCFF